jgi:hypothetical protein
VRGLGCQLGIVEVLGDEADIDEDKVDGEVFLLLGLFFSISGAWTKGILIPEMAVGWSRCSQRDWRYRLSSR